MNTMKSINPATGALTREFPELTDAELEQKLVKATRAFRTHRRTSFADRAQHMLRAAEILEAEKRQLGELMVQEMGKTIGAAIAEAEKCALGCRYYAEHAEEFLADEPVKTDAKQSFIHYQPLGPILAIMPWNFPSGRCSGLRRRR
jgi:succinate-semialdehyde dehydrogenase/glutarate-semialdehyde dehydrogenase